MPSLAEEWNAFVAKSKNGTFLFDRKYMDYHSDRFVDHSLLFYDSHGLFAVLPANQVGKTFYTHQGLTYGGLIVNEKATTSAICELFSALNDYLRHFSFEKVVYKAVPWIYHKQASEEDLYALFRVCNARLIQRHISSTIFMQDAISWRRDHRYSGRKAVADGIIVNQSDDFENFWQILTNNLHQKYDAKPVHSLEEIKILHHRFPGNIQLYLASEQKELIGGTVIYLCGQVAHAQYISASPQGKQRHAIDAIFYELLIQHPLNCLFFDFGKSSNGDGHELNESLIFQKEGFGARGICYDWYEWEL
jgi:hypothetical protein